MSYGFIITRHVNSEITNKYWNQCVRCIRQFYPFKKIVIIDDNSNQDLIKADFEYINVEIIQSEYPGRGELLPYVYFLRRHFFDNAVIIHDSVFFHKRVKFESIIKKGVFVLPLWHFDSQNDPDTVGNNNTMRIASSLKNGGFIQNRFRTVVSKNHINILGLPTEKKWFGCFGVQSFINYSFLCVLQQKYSITNLLNVVKNRNDRCSLERIMAIMFYAEYPILSKIKSLLGGIFEYIRWGYTYDEYVRNIMIQNRVERPIIKVWTGR